MPRLNPKRFAAKLLLQFRLDGKTTSAKRRICEERTVVFTATTPRTALAAARRKGRAAQFNYLNDDGNPVFFEFIGVADLLRLDPVCAPDEVWYDVRQMHTPMERKRTLLPSDAKLLARCK